MGGGEGADEVAYPFLYGTNVVGQICKLIVVLIIPLFNLLCCAYVMPGTCMFMQLLVCYMQLDKCYMHVLAFFLH